MIRVPVLDGHTAAVFVSSLRNLLRNSLLSIRKLQWRTTEIRTSKCSKTDDPVLRRDNRPQVREDVDYENGMGISVGRLREDTVYDYKFVGLSHNTVVEQQVELFYVLRH